jgi:uncharacterized membrane protein YgcG
MKNNLTIKTFLIGLLAIVVLMAGAQIARACSIDEFSDYIFWPLDGATDIPLNAQPIIGTIYADTSARLIETGTGAEIPITKTPHQKIDLGKRIALLMETAELLKPNTTYTIFLNEYEEDSSVFTTGTTVDNEATSIAPGDVEVIIDWADDDEEVSLEGPCYGSSDVDRDSIYTDYYDEETLDHYSLAAHYNITIAINDDYSNPIIRTIQVQNNGGEKQDLGTSTSDFRPDRILPSDGIETIVYTLAIEDILGNTMENEIIVTVNLNAGDSSYTVAIGDTTTGGSGRGEDGGGSGGGGGESEGTGSIGCQLSQHGTTSNALPITLMAMLLILTIGLMRKLHYKASSVN